MTTKGIETVLIETQNWGKSVAFWKSLGYEIEFETDHHSGQLRHPQAGRPLHRRTSARAAASHGSGLKRRRSAAFVPPASGTVKRPFTKEHWGVLQMLIGDPDGREVSIEAPLQRREGSHG